MTRPKFIADYPSEYQALAERFEKNFVGVVEIKFKTVARAKSFRLGFYAFRAAAKREGLCVYGGMYPNMAAIYAQCLDNPPRIVFSHNDFGEEAKAIAEALQKDAELYSQVVVETKS